MSDGPEPGRSCRANSPTRRAVRLRRVLSAVQAVVLADAHGHGTGEPERATLMFIGEAPGADEDAQGLAFVGRAGQLLTKIIEAIGLSRSDVFIANVLKCRPPENRNPEADEVEACLPYLREQIRLIGPKRDRHARDVRDAGDPRDRRSRSGSFAGAFIRSGDDRRHADLPPGVPASQPRAEARRLGRHEEGPRAAEEQLRRE